MIEHLTDEQLRCIRACAPTLIERPRKRYTTETIASDFGLKDREAARKWLAYNSIERFYARGCIWVLWESLIDFFLLDHELPALDIPTIVNHRT